MLGFHGMHGCNITGFLHYIVPELTVFYLFTFVSELSIFVMTLLQMENVAKQYWQTLL